MRDDHFTQVEVGSEVKGFPKHVCERSQVNNLNVDIIRTREEKEEGKSQIVCWNFVLRGQNPDNSYLPLFLSVSLNL